MVPRYPSLLRQHQQRGFAQIVRVMPRTVSLTNSFVVLDKDEESNAFKLKLRFTSKEMTMDSEDTLRDIEGRLKSIGEAKQKAEFFAPDGSRYASSAKLKHIIQMPFFRLRLDSNKTDYHIHSLKAFGEPVSHLNASQEQIYAQCRDQFNLKDVKARTVSKFAAHVIDELEQNSPSKTYTQQEVAMLIRDSLAMRALRVNTDRDALMHEL